MATTYRVSYTPAAQDQIEEILDYFLEEHSLDLAVAIQNAFIDALEKAAKMPTAYPLDAKFVSKSGKKYRRIIAKNYALTYDIMEVIGEIMVVRVYHIKIGPNFFKEDLP